MSGLMPNKRDDVLECCSVCNLEENVSRITLSTMHEGNSKRVRVGVVECVCVMGWHGLVRKHKTNKLHRLKPHTSHVTADYL